MLPVRAITSWSVAAIAAAIVAGLWLMLLHNPHARRQAASDVSSRHEQLSPVPPAGERSPARPTVASPIGVLPSAPPSLNVSPEQLQRNALVIARQTELLEARMRDDDRDERAASAETALVSAYAKAEFGGGPVDVACRTSPCKIALGAGETDEVRAEVQHMSVAAPWSAPGFMLFDSDRHRVTFYLAREGHTLPEVPSSESGGP
jgi:hypothetical protein